MVITSFKPQKSLSDGWFGILHSNQPTSYLRHKDSPVPEPFFIRSIFLKESGYQLTIPYIRPENEVVYSDDQGLGSLLIKRSRIASWGNNPFDNFSQILLEPSEDDLYLYFEPSKEDKNIILLKSK